MPDPPMWPPGTGPSPPFAIPARETPTRSACHRTLPAGSVAHRESCATLHGSSALAIVQDVIDELLSPVVQAARDELQNPRLLSDRIAIGRALWRDLVIGFAAQLGELRLGFTQLAALYAVAGTETLTIADLAEHIGRSPSATSRIVAGLDARGLVHRAEEVADRRQRVL